MKETTPQPCTSKQSLISIALDDEDTINMTLNIKDEEAEIADLKLPLSAAEHENCAVKGALGTAAEDERIAKIEFLCSTCEMHEIVHYFGRTPPFVCGLQLLEDTFIMRDPFQPPPPRWKPKAEYFIAIGAKCVDCQRCVCKDAACSFYYTSTFCLSCAEKNVQSLPLEVQAKLRKQLAAK